MGSDRGRGNSIAEARTKVLLRVLAKVARTEAKFLTEEKT